MNNVMKCFWVLSLLCLLSNAADAKYTKVANDGSGLADTAPLGTGNQDWACNYDNMSKLIWEVKNPNIPLRSPYASYTWYDSNPDTNGGDVGTANGGNCSDRGNCDTEKYVQSINKLGLCGFHDWRLPTLDELKTLLNTQYQPAIDPTFFPDSNISTNVTTSLAANIQVRGYWSSSTTNLIVLKHASETGNSTDISPKIAVSNLALTQTNINTNLVNQTTTIAPSVTTTVIKPITSVIKPIDIVIDPTPPPLGKAWYLSFETTNSLYETKNVRHLVRLVRAAKDFIPPTEKPPVVDTGPVNPPPIQNPPVTTGPTEEPTDTGNDSGVLTSEIWREEFNNVADPGAAFGISYEDTPLGQGARFTRDAQSRIDYPFKVGLPSSGTLEFRVNIDSAYSFIDSKLSTNNACAIIFKTLAQGDYIYPGSAKFSACKNGDVSLSVETQYGGDGPTQTLTAKNTAFRFGEWHVVSFSYGKNGQAISVDNKVLSEAPRNTQAISASAAAFIVQDASALGQAKSVSSENPDYEGFEGVVDTFRASKTSKDWLLGKDFPLPTNLIAYGSFSRLNNSMAQAIPILVNDVPQLQTFNSSQDELWLTFHTKPGVRYTINIPDKSVGSAIGPILSLYDNSGNLLAQGGEGVLGKGQQLQIIGTGQPFNIQINTSLQSCSTSIPGDISNKRVHPKEGDGCANSDLTTTSYKIQVYMTDNPQQGIVKGFVVTECLKNGIGQANVSGLLNGAVNESTTSHNDGQFGLPLTPNTYQLQSQATNFIDKTIGPLNVGVENITQVQLEQTPAVGCANYQAPGIDPSIQEQQAVAVYDDVQGLLIIRDVTTSGLVFYVELRNIGDFHFRLDRIVQLNNTLHTQPAVYDHPTLTVDIPTVFAFNHTWHVQFEHHGDWIFTIKNYAFVY